MQPVRSPGRREYTWLAARWLLRRKVLPQLVLDKRWTKSLAFRGPSSQSGEPTKGCILLRKGHTGPMNGHSIQIISRVGAVTNGICIQVTFSPAPLYKMTCISTFCPHLRTSTCKLHLSSPTQEFLLDTFSPRKLLKLAICAK